MKEKYTKGYVGLLALLIVAALILWIFVRMYLTPEPPLLPPSSDMATSATSSQTRIEQMHSYKDDATRAARDMEKHNAEALEI